MGLYPLNLKLAGRPCAVVGGGRVAERKIRRLIAAGASVTVIAPDLTSALREMASRQEICWRQAGYAPGMLQGFVLVFCASNDAKVNERASKEARASGALVNDAVTPEQSDFFVPASVERGDLLLTVATGGRSPALSRVLRQELEREFPPAFGEWLDRLAVLRAELHAYLATSESRQAFWRHALSESVLEQIRSGQLDRAEGEIRDAITGIGTESQDGSR